MVNITSVATNVNLGLEINSTTSVHELEMLTVMPLLHSLTMMSPLF